MTKTQYSPAIRRRFLELTLESGQMKPKKAAELLGVVLSTAYQWRLIAKKEGRWDAKPRGGDFKSVHVEEHAIELLEWQRSGLKVPEMSNRLAALDCKHSSEDAIRDFFKRHGVKLESGRPKKEVTEPLQSGREQRSLELSLDDRLRLLQISLKGKQEYRLVRRANALLCLDQGVTVSETARRLLVSPTTVANWLKTAQVGGIDALLRFNYRGADCKLSRKQVRKLQKWIFRKNPGSLKRIVNWIWKTFRVSYSLYGLSKLLNRRGFCHRKPAKYGKLAPLKDQLAFIDWYQSLVQSLGVHDVVVFFDGVHPENNSKPRGFWGVKGVRYGVRRSSGRQRENIHGALDLIGAKLTFLVEETINGDSVIRLIEKLLEEYRDNVAKGGKIYMISDNAGYYKSKDVTAWLKHNGLDDTIHRHYLPPYSPHLNPIEFLWRVMHEHVTHNCSYENFKHFKEALLHYLSVVLPRQLKSGEIANIVNDNFRPITTKGVIMINRVAA